MMGCYDFCGHYEWTFGWLEELGGHELVRDYWLEAISRDAQTHAEALIVAHGIEGMRRYWEHTLAEEAAEHVMTATDKVYRIDMQQCPSKGFLIQNGLEQHRDYCDHCMGWIGPMMKKAGFVVDHQHNHRGQCWWEMRKADDPTPPSLPGTLSGAHDVRLREDWKTADTDHYDRATDPDAKTPAA